MFWLSKTSKCSLFSLCDNFRVHSSLRLIWVEQLPCLPDHYLRKVLTLSPNLARGFIKKLITHVRNPIAFFKSDLTICKNVCWWIRFWIWFLSDKVDARMGWSTPSVENKITYAYQKKCFFVEHESSSSKLYKVCHGKHLLVLTNTLQPQSTRKW